MSADPTFRANQFLAEAKEKARLFRWKEAAQLCNQWVDRVQGADDPVEEAGAMEFAAECNFKGAFQSQNRIDFEKNMIIAKDLYGRTSEYFDKAKRHALARRAMSRKTLATFWLLTDVTTRRATITDCVASSREAAEMLVKQGDEEALAESRLDLMKSLRESCTLSTEYRTLKDEFKEALDNGKLVIARLENTSRKQALLECLSLLVWLMAVPAQAVLTPSEFQALEPETRRLEAKLLDISRTLGTPFAICLAKEAAGHVAFDLEGNPSKALILYKESATVAKELEDALLLGRLFWVIAHAEYWLSLGEEDGERRRILLSEGLDLSSKAIKLLESSFSTSDLALAYAEYAGCHIEFANSVETDPARKKDHFRKAVEMASKGVLFEEGTLASNKAALTMAKAMYFLSRVEQHDKKKTILREALPVNQNTVLVADRLLPHFWEPVVMRYYLALVEAELALEEQNPETKRGFLRNAVNHLEQSLELGSKWATNPSLHLRLTQFRESYGDILLQLYSLTNESGLARNSINAYETVLESLTRSMRLGAAGPVRWKIARVYDRLGEFDSASVAFKAAAEQYRAAAETLPGLNPTYEELARYMDAWNHTELARLNHGSGNFSSAALEYSNAAEILQSSKTWDYLARLFKARSTLESGEDRSRRESHDEAVRCFTSAATAFKEARDQLAVRSGQSSQLIEREEIGEWLKVTEARDDYCHFRAELEEARALDKRGERTACARKYQIASDGFRRLRATGSAQDPEELEVLASFCDAWSKMQDADAQSSPELYSEAADRFLTVKETHAKEQLRLLGLANSSICRALEAGTRFRQTREIQSYSDVKKWLESAADYYREAGFKKTETWTRATQRLFDALVYASQAEADKDPRKKTGLYHLAETQLELAAKLYDEAGFPGKKLEALGRLERAREERQVLVDALANLSQIPTLAGSSLVPVTLSRGQPSGLERFEEAYVVGELGVPRNEIVAGTTLTLDIDMANVGKTAATLLKVDGLVQEGLVFNDAKNSYKRENGSINLAGKRLDHLQTFKARITLAASNKGNYALRPKIFFTDDRGNYKSYEFRLNNLKVLESGLPSEPAMSTLAPSTIQVQLPQDFRFDTQRAREVFERLVNDFIKDYVSKRVSMDNAGWRSLMEIVREAKTPRSSFYGPQGKVGPVLAELERRGLVEVRVFRGERGRGGTVRKLRVAYDNRIVRDIIQKAVMANS